MVTTYTKNYSSPFIPKGIYYGTVQRVDETANRVWVKIPRIAPGFSVGPIAVIGEILPAVGSRVACTYTESDTDLVVVGQFLDIGDVTESSWTATLETTSETTVRSFSTSTYRSAKFLVQVSEGSNFLLTEILAIHDGSSVSFTEYGQVTIGTLPATFDVDIIDGNLCLRAISASANSTTYKIKTTVIGA